MIDALATAAPHAFGPYCPLGLPLAADPALDPLLDQATAAGASRERLLDELATRTAVPHHEVHCAATLYALARLVVRAHAADLPPSGAPPDLPARAAATASDAATEVLLLDLTRDNDAFEPLRPYCSTPRASDPPHPLTAAASTAPTWVATLRAPLETGSLRDQLAAALETWAAWLPAEVGELAWRVVGAADEMTQFRGPGPGPAQPPMVIDDREHEAFTPDRSWMSEVVVIAKLTHVWLDQLSKRYGREVRTLDQIPDEVLDELAGWGFTGLWLIGLWQRSAASRQIKQRMGNPDALASAYALFDDVIADDLGGDAALDHLRARAEARGIRLCADMVPNHVGVDARWVIERPDLFVQLDHPPYPNHTFDGPDLSSDDRVGIHLEDGYWNRSDASVVFKRTDRQTGDVRYLYHGNDGTQMPWNDTAQLDFLNPATRAAVIDRILVIARRFPVIRFDAAMTLARRHVRRLWHPTPGDAGAIPSRARYAAAPEAFDAAMPREFWREVVDRVNAEAPDTLLLAEAFWMMEGYFVRTLGMHRVYNSAFMNMLKTEDNAGYRRAIKEVLAFSPEVLKRFANFMNNPDEETAIAQFGDGDKYIGCAILMVTLPGLPLFGHGQVEGFTEKYGMEYPRAYQDEQPKQWLVDRHAREVFPLMRRRHLFAEADDFELYDFTTPDGAVCEDVFAFSNRRDGERALVVYNNAYARASGFVRDAVETARGRTTLTAALGLEPGETYRFRDHRDGQPYERSTEDLQREGLYAALDGFGYHVFLDWERVVTEPEVEAEPEASSDPEDQPSVLGASTLPTD